MSNEHISGPVALGIDVGGTHVRAALVTREGSTENSVRRKIVRRDPEGLLETLVELRDELQPGTGSRIPIGVGLAAQISVETGHVAVAPNLGWRDVSFGPMLRDRLAQPVRLVNDLNAIAAGEAACGAGEGASDVVCVFVGTGVGMGAVVHGRLIEGADGLAAELGHIKVASTTDGRLCGCGDRGCLEAYTSGRHLPELYIAEAAGSETALLKEAGGDSTKLTSDRIEAAAENGDAAARALWDDVGDALGVAIANVVVLFNPRVVVLGGGVLLTSSSLKQRVVERISATLSPAYRDRTQLRDSRLGDDAGIIGAALLA